MLFALGCRNSCGLLNNPPMKNKTLATWLAFAFGPLGVHRFYLHGITDWLGWLLPIPTALGLYGIQRAKQFGLDDTASWVLIPFLGFTLAACAGMAIYYGLMDAEKWNARFQPDQPSAAAGQTNWLTIGAIALALLLGTTVLMASLAFSFQRYFEYQIEQAKLISQ
jgi:TM2 domain-containing membrane protein YozV